MQRGVRVQYSWPPPENTYCGVPIVCELKKRDALPSGYLKSVLRLLSCQAVRQSFQPRPPLRIAAGNKFGKVSLRIIIIVVVVSMTRQLPLMSWYAKGGFAKN